MAKNGGLMCILWCMTLMRSKVPTKSPVGNARKSKRKSRPASVASVRPPAEREYAGLRLFLSRTEGFRLALATFDRPATRDGLIARLTNDLTKSSVLLTRLDVSASQASLLIQVEDHVRQHPVPFGWNRAIAIANLEAKLV